MYCFTAVYERCIFYRCYRYGTAHPKEKIRFHPKAGEYITTGTNLIIGFTYYCSNVTMQNTITETKFLTAIIIYISNIRPRTIVRMNANLFANITQKLRLTIAGALIFDV